jgi:hypothetical protein
MVNDVKKMAEENKCDNCYEDYEFENKTQFQRRHCVIYVDFAQGNLNNMVEFLNQIKKTQDIHVELIYDDVNKQILYASQYFITQKMDKYAANEFRIFKRKRSYSDDENMILKALSK